MSWPKVQLKTVAQVRGGKRLPPKVSFASEVTPHPYIRVSDFKNGSVDQAKLKYLYPADIESIKRYTISKEDLYISIAGTLGTVGTVPSELHGAQLTENAAKICIKEQTKIHRDFLQYVLTGSSVQSQFALEAGIGGGVPKLALFRIEAVEIPLPPLPIQLKIANILSTWGEAIEKLDTLIAAKDRCKHALMQQLLTGKKRLKGFKGKWRKVQLEEVAENKSDQNKGRMGTTSLYGVTKADGVVPMRDHVKGESFARCKRVETDWFAYNPMRINIGSIARWQGAETVMVSGDYVVFRCLPNRLSPAYLDHLRRTWRWQSFVTRGGNGSVRIRIYFSDLGEFTFPCPPIEEQEAIAAILDTADQEITLLRKQRNALEQQKRGLMQRLLTGKIRVKVNP